MTTLMSMDLEQPSTSSPTPTQYASNNLPLPCPLFGNPQTQVVSPFKGSHHRRAISDVTADILDPFSVSSFACMDEFGPDDDPFSKYIDVDRLGGISGEVEKNNGGNESEKKEEGKNVKPKSRPKHRHSRSSGGEIVKSKKAMPANMLAELWVIDPKRAKRILANRQSAARSKERKARYIVELEKKVQALEKEARTLSTKFAVYQRDVTNLAAANAELNLQLREMEPQIQLRIDLNESLKREAERLRVATGERMGAQQHMTSVANLQIPQSPQVGPHNNVYRMTMPTQHLHPPITHQSNSEYLQNGPSTICCLQEGIDIYGIEQLLKVETPPTCASESNSTIIAAEF